MFQDRASVRLYSVEMMDDTPRRRKADHENLYPMCSPEMVRRHEEMILGNRLILDGFIERYDRDREECSLRYREDREAARKQNEDVNRQLQRIEKFMYEVAPNYKVLVYFVVAGVMGAFGLLFKSIWDHVSIFTSGK